LAAIEPREEKETNMAEEAVKSAGKLDVLGDETFMSADNLRTYMTNMGMTKAAKEVAAMAKADAARETLIRTLQEKLDLTPAKVAELKQNLVAKLHSAAERGETEVMVMRFPNSLCSDKGRAINNAEAGWPDSLTGRPRQAYEFWRDHLKDANYRLTAMVVDWPAGLPGDIALFVSWR
jgi:membrane carboxypeptidase/penicillin-binding protein